MKILLIDFHCGKNFPSLTLRTLAGLTPSKHEVYLADTAENKSKYIDYNMDYDVVGISTVSRYSFEAYEIADNFRRQGIKVVLGGWHASALPDEAKQHADSVLIGEAEVNWPRLLSDIEQNRLNRFYRNHSPVDLDLLPDYKGEYGDRISVESSRGCPMGCNFCFISNSQYGTIYRKRQIDNVLKDIKSIKNNFFSFVDASFTIDRDHSINLFNELEGLNKRFIANGNIGILGKDEELLRAARNAGCIAWLVGFESISQKSIKEIGKSSNTVKEYRSAVRKIHDNNMYVIGNFVFGFDSDTLDIFDNTIEAVKSIGVDIVDTSVLTPFPNTPLFNSLEKESRILTRDWRKYNFEDVVFEPKNMSAEELFYHNKRAFKEIYSCSNTLGRIFRSFRLGFKLSLDVARRNTIHKPYHSFCHF